MNIDDLLKGVGADELVGGRAAWQGDKMTPYTLDEMQAFDAMDASSSAVQKNEFKLFQKRYDALSQEERDAIESWAQSTFVDPMWSNTRKFPRPEFAHKRFFSKFDLSGAMLDLAPAHGCHGVLLYRDLYNYNLEIHTCDFVPAYNKLLTVLGLKVKHVDLRFDRLNVEYQQKFNVVTVTEVLEHVDEATENKICADLHDITSQGSKVFITFPEIALPSGAPLKDDPLGHVRQPTVDGVSSKLNGFKVLESGLFHSGKVNQIFMIAERL